jgi:hypothetical protein
MQRGAPTVGGRSARSRRFGNAPRRSIASYWKVLVVVVAVVEAVILAFLLVDRDSARPPSDARPEESSNETSTETVENHDTGYEFRYPDTWTLERHGSVSTVSPPGDDVVLGVGPAPSGELLDAADGLIDRLDRTYKDVRPGPPEVLSIDAATAVSVKGSAVNLYGTDVRFEVLTIEGRQRNFGITAFSSKDVPEDEAEQDVQEIVDSFHRKQGERLSGLSVSE